MNSNTVREVIVGPAGHIECALDAPTTEPLGVVVICHPHPLHGGTMDNKVVQTIARAFLSQGYLCVRFNYRGVGASKGSWDGGVGEVTDALAVIRHHYLANKPLILAGFSFGAFVAAQARILLEQTHEVSWLVVVGPSTLRQQMATVPANTLVIHGETDDVVPLSATLEWARPQNLPVVVFPGVGHFFHGQLGLLKRVLCQHLRLFISTVT